MTRMPDAVEIEVVAAAGSCSARCSTSGRSTTVSARRGAARLRCWTRRRARGSWRCSPRIGPRLPPSRQGTRWLDVLKVQVCYRLIDPGSDWRLHRHWYAHSALRDLLGTDGRHLVLPRHTRPNKEHDLLLHQLNLQLPAQPAPRLTTPDDREAARFNHMWASTLSCGTPLPLAYMSPRLYWARASPCSAARRNHRAASAASSGTPSPLSFDARRPGRAVRINHIRHNALTPPGS